LCVCRPEDASCYIEKKAGMEPKRKGNSPTGADPCAARDGAAWGGGRVAFCAKGGVRVHGLSLEVLKAGLQVRSLSPLGPARSGREGRRVDRAERTGR
jgi:hypothetical protein